VVWTALVIVERDRTCRVVAAVLLMTTTIACDGIFGIRRLTDESPAVDRSTFVCDGACADADVRESPPPAPDAGAPDGGPETSDGVVGDASLSDAAVADATIADGGAHTGVQNGAGGDAMLGSALDSSVAAVSDAGAADTTDAADASDAESLPIPCEAGSCPPTVLVSLVTGMQGVAVDSTNVYFTDSLEGFIWKCAVGGCDDTPTLLSQSPLYPQAIVVQSGNVYWLAYDTTDGGYGGLWASPTAGYDRYPTPLVLGQVGAMSLVLDGTNAYWTNQGYGGPSSGSVMTCIFGPQGGCAPTPLASARSLVVTFGGGIAVQNAFVYWADAEGILRCPVDGCVGGQPSPVVPGVQAEWMTVNGDNLYWAAEVPGAEGGTMVQISKCSVEGCMDPDGGGPVTLAVEIGAAQGLVADDANVYWTNFDLGRVVRCGVDGCGGTPTVLADRQSQPCRLTMDAENIYWATCGNDGYGAVYSLAK
jgi:hypothetical protein